jgi:hypothetical protein
VDILTSGSCVVRITGMSHPHLAASPNLDGSSQYLCYSSPHFSSAADSLIFIFSCITYPCNPLTGFPVLKIIANLVLVAHACNPSYWGGRDQEDSGSKPTWANSSKRLYLEKPFTKKGWWSGSSCRPWVTTIFVSKFVTVPNFCLLFIICNVGDQTLGLAYVRKHSFTELYSQFLFIKRSFSVRLFRQDSGRGA